MFSKTTSVLLHRRQPLILYNVCGRHKLRKRQEAYQALLLAQLWLKEAEKDKFVSIQTKNNKDILDEEFDFTKQDFYGSNKKEQFMLSDDGLIYTVSLIHNYMLNSEICEKPTKFATLNKIKLLNSEDKRWYLDKITCDMLYKTLGEHIDKQKEKIF